MIANCVPGRPGRAERREVYAVQRTVPSQGNEQQQQGGVGREDGEERHGHQATHIAACEPETAANRVKDRPAFDQYGLRHVSGSTRQEKEQTEAEYRRRNDSQRDDDAGDPGRYISEYKRGDRYKPKDHASAHGGDPRRHHQPERNQKRAAKQAPESFLDRAVGRARAHRFIRQQMSDEVPRGSANDDHAE